MVADKVCYTKKMETHSQMIFRYQPKSNLLKSPFNEKQWFGKS